MKSINLRISPETARAVKALRERGVNVSDFLRTQLINEAARLHKKEDRRSVKEILAAIDAAHPPDLSVPHHGVDMTDRRAVSDYIHNKLAAKQKRIADDFRRQQRTGRARRSA